MAATKRKSGPRTVYERDQTETIRLSTLAKRIARENSDRTEKSVGDFVEHLLRTRAKDVRPDEFPADDRAASATV